MYKRAQSGIGYLAQEASVFRKLRVEDNILSVLQLTKLSKKQQLHCIQTILKDIWVFLYFVLKKLYLCPIN